MKFEHILYPLDFSERSRAMRLQVEVLARRFGSKVTVLHVFEIPSTWYGSAEAPTINVDCFQQFYDAAQRSLDEFQLDLPENCVEKVLAEGDPAWIIADWARQHPTDLIMLGTRGFGKLQGLLLGSVAAKVIHDTPFPVWTDASAGGNASFQNNMGHILCAIDIDAETEPLLRFAGEVSRAFLAELHLIHCIPDTEARSNKYFDFDLQRYQMEGARIELTKLQREAGVECETAIATGSIAKAVRKLALENHAGLIVLGRGESRQRFGRLRTHAYQIIHDAPCPVLSYCPVPPTHTSSSCSEERPARSVAAAPPPIGSSPL
jgi:nucleotide-binding universal stress UspA family protein